MDTEGPTWEELGYDPRVVAALREAGYERPLPVQAACARPVLDGQHLVVRSRTGSGKTLAYVAPVVSRLDPATPGPWALVLAPTRELALQVHGEFEKTCPAVGSRAAAIYGGTGYGEQLRRLAGGVHVVTGTPGRVLDHFRRRTLDLSRVRVLVLDEADEMLSAGFWDEVQKVLSGLKNLRQILLFSATLPPHIERLIARHMRDPARVDLSEDRVDVDRIQNVAYTLHPEETRVRSLMAVLEAEDPTCAIIFCNTRSDTEMVAAYLRRRGYNAALLNSDLPQSRREEVMGRMKAGTLRYLVATDLAARGIDISFLPCVIHYEPPPDLERYIHRTGRTGRVDRTGRAVTLLAPTDHLFEQRLAWRYGIRLSRHVPPTREEALTMMADRRIREIKERLEAGAVVPEEFRAIAREVLSDPEAESVVAFLVDEYLSRPREGEQPVQESPGTGVPGSGRSGGNGRRRRRGRRRRGPEPSAG